MPMRNGQDSGLTQIGHRQARIIVVDDEPVNLRLLQRLLEGQGYSNLVLIQDARDVLDAIKAERADLVLLDLHMPHMSGYQVLAQLKGLGDPLAPPVIVVTAQQDRECLVKAFESGARDFIGKPFDRLELQARVRNLLDAHTAHRMAVDQQQVLIDMVKSRTAELEEARLQIVARLGRAAEYRDNETGMHVVRIGKMSAALARSLSWSSRACETIMHASPMHDIGKIGIPDSILLKTGPLDKDEWEVMKTHTRIGAEILQGDKSELVRMARDIALSHHEKWDGSGYPSGLAGEAIPLAGRIVAVVDVFDALLSERPYKRAWAEQDAIDYLTQAAGTHFDPVIVRRFMSILPEIRGIRGRYAEPEEGAGLDSAMPEGLRQPALR